MKIRTLIAVLSLSIGGAAFAQAAPKDPLATPRIDQREANQEKRIEQGVASGQLTPRETKRLEMHEKRIASACATDGASDSALIAVCFIASTP